MTIDKRTEEQDQLFTLVVGVVYIVRDRKGQPLAGVTIGVEGRAVACVTDEEGRFSLSNMPHGRVALLVARAGEPPRRIEVEVPWAFDIVLR